MNVRVIKKKNWLKDLHSGNSLNKEKKGKKRNKEVSVFCTLLHVHSILHR